MKGIKCVCGRTARYVKHLKFNGFDIDGWECKSCKEEYYNPEKAERILLMKQEKISDEELALIKKLIKACDEKNLYGTEKELFEKLTKNQRKLRKAFGSLKLKEPTQKAMDEIDGGYD